MYQYYQYNVHFFKFICLVLFVFLVLTHFVILAHLIYTITSDFYTLQYEKMSYRFFPHTAAFSPHALLPLSQHAYLG